MQTELKVEKFLSKGNLKELFNAHENDKIIMQSIYLIP